MSTFKKFYNKRREHRFSREYELNKYEYFRDLEFDYQKYLEELEEENIDQKKNWYLENLRDSYL